MLILNFKILQPYLITFASFAYWDLTKDSSASLEYNTLNHCINWFPLFYFIFENWQRDGKIWYIGKWNAAKMVIYFSNYMRQKLGVDILNYAEYIKMTVSEIRIEREDRILKISASILEYSNRSIKQKWKYLI